MLLPLHKCDRQRFVQPIGNQIRRRGPEKPVERAAKEIGVILVHHDDIHVGLTSGPHFISERLPRLSDKRVLVQVEKEVGRHICGLTAAKETTAAAERSLRAFC
jgi:hypothetical protein